MRAAMVMSPGRGGVFDVLLRLAHLGLGGPVAGGAWLRHVSLRLPQRLLLAAGRPPCGRPVDQTWPPGEVPTENALTG
ncbi:hypothetical protein [Nonomuraea sp. GTA35]|uniref:hypothetical protein n=1 Tax=Nonomuraea sp. GTA35 TaxID=1676746 RepID=UPI0035C03C92